MVPEARRHVRKAICLCEQRAGEAHQRIRERHARHDLRADSHALRTRHAHVRTRRTHAESEVALQKKRQDCGDDHHQHQEKGRAEEVIGNPQRI
jgi:hypothetical protein